MTLFVLLAVAFAIAAALLIVVPLIASPGDRHPVAAVAAALGVPVAAIAIYTFSSNHDWLAAPSPPAASSANEAAASMDAAVAGLEARLRDNPQDAAGWKLLGSSYVVLGRSADAITAYEKALSLPGGRTTDVELGLAEARILQDGNALAGEAGGVIERVLAAEPDNPKALWYGGLRALSRGESGVARRRWQALLELAPPERIRNIVENQLAQLGSLDAETGAAPPAAATGGPVLRVSVTLSDAVKGGANPGAPLFVFVRDAASAGPPLAVVRRSVSDLPLTVELSDRDMMIPGRSLGTVKGAQLVARVANSGDPLPKAGDLFGEAAWSAGDTAGNPVRIVIDQVVGQ